MQYPFLDYNTLILVDYLPGSSGQLLLRLWSELDVRMKYENALLLSKISVTDHPASKEISYDIKIPKRLVNWFLDKCKPCTVDDYLQFFEFIGTSLVAASQKWIHGTNSIKFYESFEYEMKNHCILYGMHSMDTIMPIKQMIERYPNIKIISIIPSTDIGLRYQYDRFHACYPIAGTVWSNFLATSRRNSNHHNANWRYRHRMIDRFNSKCCHVSFDFCTLLANKDTDGIINWLLQQIGDNVRADKVNYVRRILSVYYTEVVDQLWKLDV